MKRLLSRLALVSIAAVTPAQADSPVVVELFTSQGCSSCPPADALLAELSGRDDVLALSMHVDYWDYLGWADTFASPEMTARQHAYREATGARVVYTPQLVVQGDPERTGRGRAALMAAISDAAARPAPVSIRLEESPGMLHAILEPGAEPVTATVWVVTYDRESTVEILRGENRGREITYHNVVRSLIRIGSWDGGETLDVPMPQPGPGEGCAILLQEGDAGPILAAAKVEG